MLSNQLIHFQLEENEYVRESDNKKWHFYDIIAQKKVGDKHE